MGNSWKKKVCVKISLEIGFIDFFPLISFRLEKTMETNWIVLKSIKLTFIDGKLVCFIGVGSRETAFINGDTPHKNFHGSQFYGQNNRGNLFDWKNLMETNLYDLELMELN